MKPAERATEAMAQPSRLWAGGRRGLHSAVLAGGSAAAMMLAGLGVAGAQVEDASRAGQPPARNAPAAGEHGKEQCHREGDGDGRRHHRRQHKIGFGVDIAAETIGILEHDLVAALRSGRSISDVARSKSVDPGKVIDALVAAAAPRLQARADAGEVTQAQADERLAKQRERFELLVNRRLSAHYLGDNNS